jgi:hypothetical protein
MGGAASTKMGASAPPTVTSTRQTGSNGPATAPPPVARAEPIPFSRRTHRLVRLSHVDPAALPPRTAQSSAGPDPGPDILNQSPAAGTNGNDNQTRRTEPVPLEQQIHHDEPDRYRRPIPTPRTMDALRRRAAEALGVDPDSIAHMRYGPHSGGPGGERVRAPPFPEGVEIVVHLVNTANRHPSEKLKHSLTRRARGTNEDDTDESSASHSASSDTHAQGSPWREVRLKDQSKK